MLMLGALAVIGRGDGVGVVVSGFCLWWCFVVGCCWRLWQLLVDFNVVVLVHCRGGCGHGGLAFDCGCFVVVRGVGVVVIAGDGSFNAGCVMCCLFSPVLLV